MIFRQILNDDLFCASYLVADEGEAAVVDPAWNIEPYLSFARAHRLEIRHVLDTHIHADHLSGREKLAAATGAAEYLPVGSEAVRAHRMLHHGDVIPVGQVRLETLATPGHRPEHVSFLVTDLARSEQPCALLSGDSLLVGDVARPDLAAADEQGVTQAAGVLFDSLQRLSDLPDHVEVWPGHLGGSLCCGGGVTGCVASTIGFERLSNSAFAATDEATFTAELVNHLPVRPPTVDTLVRQNRGQHDQPLDVAPLLAPHYVRALQEQGALIVDGRIADAFDLLSIPGSLSVPLEALGVGSRAAWFADPWDPIVAVGGDNERALEVARRLVAVGFQRVEGILNGGLGGWRDAGYPTATTSPVDISTLARLLRDDAVTLVDLRDDDEYERLHVAGSLHLPWRDIPDRGWEAIEAGKVVVVACATGRRTPLAASALARLDGPAVLRLANADVTELGEHGVALAGDLVRVS